MEKKHLAKEDQGRTKEGAKAPIFILNISAINILP